MRALVYERGRRTIVLEEVAEPAPGGDEVLFEPLYAAICGSDLHMYAGSDGYGWVASPLPVGHEAVGRIPGDPRLFVLDPYVPCGSCLMCRLGNTSTCMGPGGGRGKESPPWSLQYGFRRPGVLAERAAVRRANLLPVPAGISPKVAALAESVAVSVHALETGIPLLRGVPAETAAVVGPGPIGLAATLALSARGIRTAVLGLPSDARRLARALALGATAALDDPAKLDAVVDGWTHGAGVDLAFEASGSAAGLAAAVRAVRRGGVVIEVGIPSGPLAMPVREVVRGAVIVAGSYGVTPRDLAAALDLLRRDATASAALIDRILPLAEGDRALMHAAGASAKVVLEIAPG